MDEPLARLTTNSLRFYQTDALGSVTALTDETGAIRTQYTYDPFGNVSVSGETSDNPFQYTGRENDETGLYYYRARYYSPELQRFISEDPIGFAGGLNFYSYVENDPILSADPLGLFGSGDKPPPPVEKNKKKDKGGPWHPPLGIKTKCLPTDSFSTLRNKIYINEKRLKSHKGWDEHMPSPRGGGKHAEDIKQIMTELAACKALDELKCGCKDGQGIPSLPKPETPFPIPPIVID